jgi:MoaA/NifB/PqqE/SkfB family radical SAM enzyme
MVEKEIVLLKLPGLRIVGKVSENRIVDVEAKGPLAPFAGKATRLFKEFVCKEKPAYVGKDFILYSPFFPPIPSKRFSKAFKAEVKAELMRRRIPEVISIAITRACSCDCIYCGYVGPYDYSKELTKEEIFSVIDQAIDLGAFTIIFYGGDPILRKDLYELIFYARSKDLWTILFTPGIHVTAKIAVKLKEAGLDSIYIVLNSKRANVHDKLLQLEGAFARALNAIKTCLKAGLWVGISTYATSDRIRSGDLENLIDFAEELGVHEVLVADIIPTGKLLRKEDIILTLEDRDLLVEIHEARNIPGTPGPRVSTSSCMKSPRGVGCIAGNKWVYVNPQGYVTPCAYIPLSFGNIRENKLQEIWNRIVRHSAFRDLKAFCRMQDLAFREKYIHPIPESVSLPYPIDKLSAA